jgi:glyoxalase/bleomycin resistance protein/dioxygenase superfamily protein
MLHHVGIEMAPGDIPNAVEFWEALGFEEIEPPEALSEYTWLERDGTQVHLMPTDSPAVPPRGHTAIVARDFVDEVAALRELGFEVEARREHWGSPRALAIAPGGHRVELMAKPPRPD